MNSEKETLKSLKIEEEYRTDSCNIVTEFYIPCLKRTLLYSRATGYFSSESLALISKGLIELIKRNGEMRLIASPDISEEDILAISNGLKTREQVIRESCTLKEIDDPSSLCRLAFLEKLISEGKLKVKLAIRKTTHGGFGIYHEKIGIFEDDSGNIVSFTGSNNETAGGLKNNFELT